MFNEYSSIHRCLAFSALLLATIACSGNSDSPSIFAPLLSALGVDSANLPFSNHLNNPANLPEDVTVSQPPQEQAGSASVQGIIALESARLGRSTRVDADVSVLSVGNPAQHDLVLRKFSRVEANRSVRADSLKLEKRASILGTAEYNSIKLGKNASVAGAITPLDDLPLLPPFLSGTPGAQKVTHADSPLAGGNYGKLKLAKKKTLVLNGGFYHFTHVRLARRSSLICETTCVVLVKNRLRANRRATLEATSANSSDLIIYVEGESQYHQDSHHHHHASVRLHRYSNTTADIYAPNGKLRLGRNANLTGNIIGKRVVVARGARVVSGEAVPRRVAQLIKAGEAGVVEIPGEIRLEIPAWALSEDQVISITPGPTAITYNPVTGQEILTKGSSYDLGPDGLAFDCPIRFEQVYDAAAFAAAGVDENDLRLFTAGTGLPFLPAPGVVDTANQRIVAEITHFSLSIIGFAPAAGPSGFPSSLTIDGNRAYATYYGDFSGPANDEAFRIFDITNPAAPAELGFFQPGGLGLSSAYVSGTTALVTDTSVEPGGASGLRVIDIGNPGAPTQSSTVPAPTGQLAMTVVGNRAYALCLTSGPFASAICVYDISNPAAPIFIGQSATFAADSNPSNIRSSGNFLFVTTLGPPFFPAGVSAVHSFDLTDPDNPAFADSHIFAAGGIVTRMAVDGNRVYTLRDNFLEILAFDGAGNLSLAGTYDAGATPNDVAALGNRAVLVTASPGDLRVLDVTDAAAVTQLDSIALADPRIVSMDANRAYVLDADPAVGLQIVDISSPGTACSTLPTTWVQTSGATTITYDCTTSGLVYTCNDRAATAPSVVYTFASVAAANLGVIDAPLVATVASGGFRGVQISVPASGLDFDYTLDGANRLATVMVPASGVATFSNHDVNGFPQTISGIATGSYAYVYGAGGSLPTQTTAILNGQTSILSYSGGLMTSWNISDGFTTGTSTTTGSALICDPPGPPPAPTVTPLPSIATNSFGNRPAHVCWNGSQYLVTWQGMPFTTRPRGRFLNGAGAPLAGEFDVSTSGHLGAQYEIACNANRFALTWAKAYPGGGGRFAPFLQMLDSTGALVGGEVQVSTPPAGQDAQSPPGIATDGANFYMAWEEYPDISNVTVRGLLVDGNGSALTGLTNFTAPKFFLGGVNLASNGVSYLTSYADFNTGLFSRRVDGAGALVGGPLLLRTQPGPVGPSVWNGSFYLNTTVRGVDIISQVINSDGTLGGSEILTGVSPGSPRLAWNGGDFLMVFVNFVNSPNFEITGQRYNASGQMVGSPFIIAAGPGNRREVRVASNGSTFLVTWNNITTGDIEAAVVSFP